MDNWLTNQAKMMVLVWEQAIGKFYPECLSEWTDPDEHVRALTHKWNYMDAARELRWHDWLSASDAEVLDLGAGTGWLSAMLSRYEQVGRIYALDASAASLTMMLPAVCDALGGRAYKITPIVGLFTPILMQDDSLDLVVASSSVHHTSNLVECFREVNRVLKAGGFFIILNETPITTLQYCLKTLYGCMKIVAAMCLRQWRPLSSAFSASEILVDPYLGDRAYCRWQYEAALKNAGFCAVSHEVSKFYPYKVSGDRRNRYRLATFIARKPMSRASTDVLPVPCTTGE
jgi:ubiquinone/menaquinone biosynthesis C-methylase UbiE